MRSSLCVLLILRGKAHITKRIFIFYVPSHVLYLKDIVLKISYNKSTCRGELDKPHAVCVPYPCQGHINSLLKLAKILHHRGFHITFVNTEYNHRCLLKSRGPDGLENLPSFRFETILDGLPPWTFAACGTLGYMHYCNLVEKGYTLFKDESYLTNGYLEMTLEWIPYLKDLHLRDLPNFIRTTNPDDYIIKCVLQETERSKNASAIIINTFEPLEKEVLESLQTLLPPVFAIGLFHLLVKRVDHKNLEDLGSNLWKENEKCLEWLDSKK